jgi:hypothetical protein
MAIVYEIEGQQVEAEKELSDAEIDEIAAQIRSSAPQAAEQPGVMSQVGRQLGLTGRTLAKSAMGGFGVADLVIDPVQAAMGMKTTAQGRDEVLDALGFPKPETTAERAAQTGVDVLTSIGAQGKAAQALIKPVTGLLQKGASKQVATALSDDLAQQVAAGVPAAVTADFIVQKAQETGADPATTGVLALSGGLLAGLTGAKTQRAFTKQKIPLFTPEMAKNQARASYQKVKEAGVSLKTTSLKNAIDDIEINLSKSEGGYYPTALPEHGKVKAMLDNFRTVADTGPVAFETLDKLRSDALKMTRESTDPSTRRLMGQVVEGIDLKMSGLQPSDLQSGGKASLGDALSSVRDAREAWRRGAKATILEDALEVALRRGEAPTGKEGEIIRKNFENLYADKKKMKLFTKEEQEAIKRVVSGGKGLETLLNYAARFNPQRSQLMAVGYAGTAGLGASVPAVATAVGGFAADKALTLMQRQAAQNVMSQIASGKIPQPRSSTAFRALVEAETQRIESMNQEPMVAP